MWLLVTTLCEAEGVDVYDLCRQATIGYTVLAELAVDTAFDRGVRQLIAGEYRDVARWATRARGLMARLSIDPGPGAAKLNRIHRALRTLEPQGRIQGNWLTASREEV